MGITKEIRIEGNLIEGSKIQIYYRGKFTKEYSENVYLVWGYGQGWKDIQEKQMTWLNDGFFAEIELTSYGELNFCFKNNFGTWDNNNGLDYSVIIETKKEVFYEEVIEVETEPVVEELVEEKNEIIEEIIEEPVVIKKVKEEKRKEKNKFKRAAGKKDKKSRRQKKIEKNKVEIKQTITDDEESLYSWENNKKVDNDFDSNIFLKEMASVNTNQPKRKTKRERSKSNLKRYKRNKIRIIIRIISLIILIVGLIYIISNYIEKREMQNKTDNLLNSVDINKIASDDQIAFAETERMLQVRELNKQYPDIKAWIEIKDTNINYPVLQRTDNDFYMRKDYEQKYSKWGSLFIDKAFDWNLPSSNILIYGHNMGDGVMFSDLLKYADKAFFDTHPTIQFTTPEEDSLYEIISVFYSRVYYKSETNVFRYYYFVNAANETEYNEFVSNAKAASIYDTGKTAEYGDQLLTLSTCEYSQDDGRFVVVARKCE